MKKELIKQIKHDVNNPKSELIRLQSRLEEISKSQAEKLGKIIGRLENWQNS